MSAFDTSLQLYEKGGQEAIYNAVARGDLPVDRWDYCPACETDVPVLKDLCLVCWTGLAAESPSDDCNTRGTDDTAREAEGS